MRRLLHQITPVANGSGEVIFMTNLRPEDTPSPFVGHAGRFITILSVHHHSGRFITIQTSHSRDLSSRR